MRIVIELPDLQAEKLRAEAQRLGVRPEELATAAVVDLVARPDADFRSAVNHVLAKNRELYRRIG